jgi:TolB-like protein/class 3 adenylate cyclase
LTGERVERRLAAVLAADVAGYSRLMGADEEDTLARLKAVRKAVVDPTIASHHGRIVKTTGDGMLVEFASAVDAARCAVEVQRGMAAQNADVPQDVRIEFRIGIHVGDIIIDDNDIFGDGVNIAARLEGIAEPGGVCISDDAQRQIRGKVDMTFDDMGPQNLKNIAEPMRAWRGLPNGNAPSTTPAKPSAEPALLPLPDKPSIAVLPFQNMSGDPEQEYFADGMVEEIITALSRKRNMFVIARNSSFTYKGKAVDIKQVGRELGVRYVLEGSVRKAGKSVRITGQLIDAATGSHLWADKFDNDLENVFDLQDQVTSSVVGAISPYVDIAEMDRARRKPTANLQAYDLYLRGMANQLQFTKEAGVAAFSLFQKAIELDPEFALAHAVSAQWFATRKAWGWSDDLKGEAKIAAAHVKRALELGKGDALVLAYAGNVSIICLGEVDFGAECLQEATKHDPNLASAWTWAGWAKIVLGDHEAALDYFRRSLRLSPLDPRNYIAQSGMAYAYFFLGEHAEATNWVATSLRQQPDYLGSLRIAAFNYALRGLTDEAHRIWSRISTLVPSGFRISDIRSPFPYRRQEDVAKIEQACRVLGVPND